MGVGHGVGCKAYWTWQPELGNFFEELDDLKIFSPCRLPTSSFSAKWGPSTQCFRQGKTLMGHVLAWYSCFPWPERVWPPEGSSEDKALHSPSWLAPTCICQTGMDSDIQQECWCREKQRQLIIHRTSLVAQGCKEPACQCRRCGFDPWVWEDPLEDEMATHSSILAWRIPWTEEPGSLESIGSQRVGHNSATNQQQSFTNLQPWRHLPFSWDSQMT